MTSIDFQSLRRQIDGEVFDDRLQRYLLATDGSIFLHQPRAVVYPKSTTDVVATVTFAADCGLTVHPRGAGSGLCGAAVGGGVILDFTRHMNRLIAIDSAAKSFTCEPGYRAGELERDLEGSGLFFPPDPSSGEYATFGGMFGTNASGAHSVKYGNVVDYILDAEVVLSDGSVITLLEIQARPYDALPSNLQALHQLYLENTEKIERGYPGVRYNVAGYNLRGLVSAGGLRMAHLFAGAEGTLGVVTRLTFRLLDKPAHDSLVVAFFDDIVPAARAVRKILPMRPSGIEIMDKSLLNLARNTDETLRKKIPDNIDNVLLIEFDAGTAEACKESANRTMRLLVSEGLTENLHMALSDGEKARFWAVRKAAVPILYKLKGQKKILALIEDAAVPTDRLADYFKGIYAILGHHGIDFVVYGHIGKGLLHIRPLLDLKAACDVRMLQVLADEMFELVHSLGGVVSGEHGDGRLRSAYIKRQYPQIHGLFLETKRLLDKNRIFNPEIKTRHDPCQMQKGLRYGSGYHAGDGGPVVLNWPEGFVREIEKCHGCSKCTTVTTATRMCPIYKFTRDEAASPKAKANLLRGLISGAIAERSIYERTFQMVIDRCAGCGSCYTECPSNVNIPKLAIEAKARYIRKFGPSMENRLVTNLETAGRTTRKLSPLLKRAAEVRSFRKFAERITGLSSRRRIPIFPSRSLFDRISAKEGGGSPRVIYFTGCYAGYVRPEIGEAAVKVLTALGVSVDIPHQHCCGLPMLSKGMTAAAVRKIQRNLSRWRRLLPLADYIIVTCSSCGYALMQDWQYLVSGPEIDVVQRKTLHVSHLINHYWSRLRLGRYPEKVVYHAPCHLKIQPHADSSLQLLSSIPDLTVEALKSHCCGMIGSWGMAAGHYDLSATMGADLIARWNESRCDVGVTDCPTCRMQMEAFGTKPVRHPVEVVAARLEQDRSVNHVSKK